MNITFPAPATIRGLCAAFLLAGTVSAVEGIFDLAATWTHPEIFASVELTSPFLFTWTLFGLVTAFAGVSLLFDRPHCVLRGLIVAWFILLFRAYGVAKLVWIIRSHPGMTLSPALLSNGFSMAVTALLAGVVVWLLHALRPQHSGDVSIPSAAQIA